MRFIHMHTYIYVWGIKDVTCTQIKCTTQLSKQQTVQKLKSFQARRESNEAKCAPQIYNLSDQFLFLTNSYFRPIPISDQFLFPTNSFFLTNSYFRPIPISDQFLFQTNSYFRPCKLWGWHIFKKARQVCGRLWKLKIKSFKNFPAPQVRSEKFAYPASL